MEDFVDSLLSSPSWCELNASSRTSWTSTITSQTNGLFGDNVEAYTEDVKNPSICMIPSTRIIGNESQESNFSVNDVYENEFSITLPHSALTMSSSIESSGSESCKFAQSLGDANSVSSVPPLWPPPSYSTASLSPFVEQRDLQGFDFQGTEGDAESMAASLHYGEGLHSPDLPGFNLGQQIKIMNGGLLPHKQEMSTYSAGPPMMLATSAGLHAHQQPSETNSLNHQRNHSSGAPQEAIPPNTAGCNRAAKPRVRARRGQATDPHSIAERLRREKISERMRSLQEIVPNSNKTDKASMLDEIIDYVKFLRLQVKVLSMSRLGAAGAVLPLITDSQSEASSLHLSSVGPRGADLSSAQDDNSAFEQEVVKLLESNITAAMQFLQTKGLCLMPIALAAAISSQKGSSSAAIPQDKQQQQPEGRGQRR